MTSGASDFPSTVVDLNNGFKKVLCEERHHSGPYLSTRQMAFPSWKSSFLGWVGGEDAGAPEKQEGRHLPYLGNRIIQFMLAKRG